jgi:hypothetical protein
MKSHGKSHLKKETKIVKKFMTNVLYSIQGQMALIKEQKNSEMKIVKINCFWVDPDPSRQGPRC